MTTQDYHALLSRFVHAVRHPGHLQDLAELLPLCANRLERRQVIANWVLPVSVRPRVIDAVEQALSGRKRT